MPTRRSRPQPHARADRYARLEEHLGSEIGARLRHAREEQGLSQEELGQALGYGATMVSAFESGRRRLKLEDLGRACIALDREPDYFLGTEKLRPAAPIGLTLRAELAQVPQEDLARSIEAFLDGLETDPPDAGAAPDLGHLRPDAAAAEVLDRAGYAGPPVKMDDVCEALAVPLLRHPFPQALSALVIALGDDRFVIGFNGWHAPTRRRFSIAHEIGHAILRHDASYYLEYAVDDASEPPGYRYLDEREANAFAAALLMDERWVRRDFADGKRSVTELAKRYKVSPAAMGFRLINLGLQ